MGRTLVIHSGGVGDLLLAAPSIEALRRSAPVVLAGIPERGALLQEAGLVETVHSLDSIAFSSIFSTPHPRFLQFVRPFERVIVWMKDPENRIHQALEAVGVAQVEVYPGLPPDDYPGHAAAYYCERLALPAPKTWRLPFPPRASQIRGRCFLHPGSGSATKNWPWDRFHRLAAALAEQGMSLKWIYGPAEREGLAQGIAHPPPTDLVTLAHDIASAQLYVGNDSGITHLAAALGVPTLAIFGPTNPHRWRPIGPRTAVVAGEPFPSLEAVLAGARTLLAPT